MRFTTPRFLIALAVTIFIGFAVVAGLRAFGILSPGLDPDAPGVLAAEAADALEAVKNRTPDDRRPASYDAVLAPLDKLLAQAKALVESPEYDPAGDYEKMRAITLPVIEIAERADAAARSETSFLAKEYRFNTQRGDACRYLANALWERILRNLPPREKYSGGTPEYPAPEMDELRRILETGISAEPDNAELFYIRGVVNRAEGLFAPAARDLETAVSLDAGLSAAWNVLGLVRINLKEFDKAEEALERARTIEADLAAEAQGQPGGEYITIVYNLATFHEALAAFYNREYRMTPTVDAQRLMQRHSADARKYFEEFLRREPATSPDAALARAKVDALP